MRVDLSPIFFNEALYLNRYPEVEELVKNGEYTNPFEHFLISEQPYQQEDFILKRRFRTITVVVPTYNMASYLEATLESIRTQSFNHWECIVVNDYSTDASLKIAQKFVNKDERFNILNHRSNGGLSAARNSGIIAARNEFICFLDADDLLMHDSLENRLNTIVKNDYPRLAGSYSATKTITEGVRVPPKSYRAKNMKSIDFISAAGTCPFNANQPMFKTEILRHLGGFHEPLTQAEDWEFWLRILRHGYRFEPTFICDVTYRSRNQSMVRKDPLTHLKISYGNFNANHQTLPPQKTYDNVPFVFQKPWIEYKKQLDLSNRVFEFCGMEIGRHGSRDEAISLANTMLPDFQGALAFHRDIEKRLKIGLKRQGVEESPLKSELEVEIIRFIDQVKNSPELSENLSSAEDFHTNQYALINGPSPGLDREIEVFFFPHKDYHVWSFNLLLPALKKENIRYLFVDISVIYRDEGVKGEIEKFGLPWVSYNSFILGNFSPKMIVCMNDWDPILRNIIRMAQKFGIKTVGIVEGVQDYQDVDTGKVRRPYQSVEFVILPGEFDKRYFGTNPEKIRVGGMPRIDELLSEKISFPKKPLVIINSNFTYNVLTECRDSWIKDVVEACNHLDLSYVISRHPADLGDFSGYTVSEKSMYDLIREGSVFVSRFSSGILESLALGKPVIYFNPHTEKVDKFTESHGAFPICISIEELIDGLRSSLQSPQKRLKNAAKFLALHCGASSDKDCSATHRTGEELISIFRKEFKERTNKRNLLKYLLLSNHSFPIQSKRTIEKGELPKNSKQSTEKIQLKLIFSFINKYLSKYFHR